MNNRTKFMSAFCVTLGEAPLFLGGVSPLITAVMFLMSLAAVFFLKKYTKSLLALNILFCIIGFLFCFYGLFTVFAQKQNLLFKILVFVFLIITLAVTFSGGFKNFYKFSVFAFFISLFCIVSIIIVCAVYFKPQNINTDFLLKFKAVDILKTFLLIFLPVYFLFDYKKETVLGSGSAVVLLCVFSLLSCGILGNGLNGFKFPFSSAVSVSNAGRYFSRLDGLVLLFFYLCSVLKCTLFTLSARDNP